MPAAIHAAFSRLDYSEWDATLRGEYKEDVQDRENFKTTLLIEYEEGKAKGIEIGKEIVKEIGRSEVRRSMISKLTDKGKTDIEIMDMLDLTAEDLSQLKD